MNETTDEIFKNKKLPDFAVCTFLMSLCKNSELSHFFSETALLICLFLLTFRRRMDGGNKVSTAPRVHRLAKARDDPQAYILKVI